MKKNDEIRLTIEDMGVNGEGIGKYDGMPFFVPNAVIGDRIVAGITKLKRHYGYARLISIEEPSPDRVEPKCPLAGKCGGCSLMALSYEKQLAWKEAQVYNALRRIGGISEDILQRAKRPIVGMDEPYHFRNKSQYPVGIDKDGDTVIGFYAPHSHRIVPIVKAGCQIAFHLDVLILDSVLKYMEETGVEAYDEKTGKGLLRHILIRRGFATGEIMVCFVVNGEKLPGEGVLVEQLLELNLADVFDGTSGAVSRDMSNLVISNKKGDKIFSGDFGAGNASVVPHITSIVLNTNTRRDNVILGRKTRTIWGTDAIRDVLLGNEYLISARSFYQVNPVQTAKLYQKAIEYAGLTGKETVWDLYCGIGTIGLSMSHDAGQVVGIEVVPEAVRDAKKNARLNGIKNVRFVEGKAEDVLASYDETADGSKMRQSYLNADDRANILSSELPKPDVIVVDPPRKGLDEITIRAMLSAAPERIVYVSCNSATLARDLKFFLDEQYEVVEYTPYDAFCHSGHIEVAAKLSLKTDSRQTS